MMLGKFLIAGYGFPAEYVLANLFSLGYNPENITLLSHSEDQRNIGLLSTARMRNIAVCQSKAKSDEAYQFVNAIKPDLILSIHYRELIPQRIIDCSRNGGINLHPSLLPDYKGANSIPWAMINGETAIGFTYHFINARFDQGNILYQERFEISQKDTAFSLFHKNIILAMSKFKTVLSMIEKGDKGIVQENKGQYYSRALPFNGQIDKSWKSEKISRFIRAMHFPPFPSAFVELDGTNYPVKTIEQYWQLLKKYK